jgi:hypothetical protein
MKTAISFPKELMTHVDVMNTLNGGSSEPVVRRQQFASHREIKLRVPGVNRENIKLEINNNKLTAYYFTLLKSQDLEIPVPKVLYDKAIPYFVDIKRITLTEQEGWMIVHLPFNEMANGFHKDLDVNQ